MYLPLKLSATILGGGLIAHWVTRRARTDGGAQESRRGLLFAAGLVTGESLMGILLAIPLALSAVWPSLGGDPLALYDAPPLGSWPGLVLVSLVGWFLYRTATHEAGKVREVRSEV
jgi:hypothetical protein